MGESEDPNRFCFIKSFKPDPIWNHKMTYKTQYATREFVNRKTVVFYIFIMLVCR